MSSPKKPAFPNDQFRSQDEYFEFAVANKVFGTDAYALKKQIDRSIPLPRIKRKFIY